MKDQYKHISKWYDKIFEPMNKGLRNTGFKMFNVKPGMNVLEIGCGTGSFLKMYQKENCSVNGVDLSSAMIEQAEKKLGKNAVLLKESASKLSFEKNQFDLILSSTVIHEMSPEIRKEVLREAKRVLKPDGRILLIDFYPGQIKNFRGFYSRVAVLIFEMLAGRDHFLNYRNFIKSGGLSYLIKSANLETENQKIVGEGNFGLYLVKK